MNLFLYQAYYEKAQMKHLDSVCVPYDNTANLTPELREYPFVKNLYEIHAKNEDDHWGLLSWRWYDKTKLEMKEFKEWILANPGYDVYHLDPFLDVASTHMNLWVQGDIWHPGMIDFGNKLLPKMGLNFDLRELLYHPDDFATCNYHVGNKKFWKSYISFIDHCLNLIENDEELKEFMYEKKRLYNGAMLPNFSFVIERLFSIHSICNRHIKIKKFPFENESYERLFGSNYSLYLDLYNQRKEHYEMMLKNHEENYDTRVELV
jgi:hypothetical protein